MNYPKAYEEYLKLPMPELAEIMAGREEIASKANLAKLIYEERQMAKKHEYEKEQIELQHSLNTQIVDKQLRLMKWSITITSVSTLIAALAGAYLAYTLTQIQRPIQTKLDSRSTFQSLIAPSISESHSEKKTIKFHYNLL